MPPKFMSPFKGEGNPIEEPQPIPEPTAIYQAPIQHMDVRISMEELVVLKKLLDRDRTSRVVHGGLKSLLTFSDEEIGTLLSFLDRL